MENTILFQSSLPGTYLVGYKVKKAKLALYRLSTLNFSLIK